MRENICKLGYIKIKHFCSAKDTGKGIERQAADWGKIFAEHISDKRFGPKISKNT